MIIELSGDWRQSPGDEQNPAYSLRYSGSF